jgi:hypothetical protein
MISQVRAPNGIAVAVLFLAIVLLGYDIYDRHYHQPASGPQTRCGASYTYNSDPGYVGKALSKHVWRNEEVVLDGYDYENCEFYDVRFHYNGTTPLKFSHNTISGESIVISTNNPALIGLVVFLKAAHLLIPQLGLALPPGANTTVPHETIR